MSIVNIYRKVNSVGVILDGKRVVVQLQSKVFSAHETGQYATEILHCRLSAMNAKTLLSLLRANLDKRRFMQTGGPQ